MPDGGCLCRCKLCLYPVPLPGISQYGPQVASETSVSTHHSGSILVLTVARHGPHFDLPWMPNPRTRIATSPKSTIACMSNLLGLDMRWSSSLLLRCKGGPVSMCPLQANLMCLLQYFTVRFCAINVCLAITLKERKDFIKPEKYSKNLPGGKRGSELLRSIFFPVYFS